MAVDYGGVALLITAISGATTVVLQIVNNFGGRQRDKKIVQLHNLVNGQSQALNKITGQEGFAQGHAAGVEDERARP